MSSLLCLPFTFTTSNSTVHTVPYSTLYKLVQSWIVRYTHTIRYTVRCTMRYGVPYTKVWTTLYRVGIPKILDQMTLDQITSDQFTGTLEIVRYGEREYGRTDVRCTANVCGERFLVLRTSGVNFSETVCLI